MLTHWPNEAKMTIALIALLAAGILAWLSGAGF